MAAEETGMAPLLRQWRDLTAGDRKAILGRMPAEQRLALHRALAEADEAEHALAARGTRFRAYSPWLGELIEACETEGPAAAGLRPQVRAGLLSAHESLSHAAGSQTPRASLAELALAALRSLRERL